MDELTGLPVQITGLGNKLIDVITPYLAPSQAKRLAKAEIVRAKGRVEAERILYEGRREIALRLWNKEQMKQLRQDETIEKALLELGDETIRTDAPNPEPDFITCWLSCVGRVSNPDLQELWARALAGEIRHRGSVSLKTLSVLEGLDREVAAAFEILCSQALYLSAREGITTGGLVLTLDDRVRSVMPSLGIDHRSVLRFNEYGLVRHDYDEFFDFPDIGDCLVYHRVYHGLRYVEPGEHSWPFRAQRLFLTQAGLEVSTVVKPVLDSPRVKYYDEALRIFLKLNDMVLVPAEPRRMAPSLRAVF